MTSKKMNFKNFISTTKFVSRILVASLVLALLFCASGCGKTETNTGSDATEAATVSQVTYEGEKELVLSGSSGTLDGTALSESDTEAIYISHDIVYYENRESYDSGNPYGEGKEDDMHTAEEAAANTVVNIAAPGIYRVSGTLQGQLRIDLGEDAYSDPNAVVTLVLDNAEISCDVAPGVIFMNVYECDGEWSAETATATVDTTAAGANIIVADGSVNTVNGSYVAKIYKDETYEDGAKKLWKQDGAFYSYMSMNISSDGNGTGTLNINAENEGLDSELHLTINSGNINIMSGDDAINTNEDGVSVTTINGGNVHILGGLGAEGDGIDSNGFLVINGGTVIASANPASDSGLDSDMGSYINGGTVIALGSTMDWPESESDQVTMNLQFAEYQSAEALIEIKNANGDVIFSYDLDEDEVVAGNNRKFIGAVISDPDLAVGETYTVWIDGVQQCYTGTDVGMGGPGFGGGMQPPEGFDPENMPEGFDPENMPEGFDPENMPEGQEPPEGFDPSQNGERPEMPNGQPGQMPQGGQAPEGFDPSKKGERPEMPEGLDSENMPEDFDPSQIGGKQGMPGGQQPSESTNDAGSATTNTEFYMTDKVNSFSGIKAA